MKTQLFVTALALAASTSAFGQAAPNADIKGATAHGNGCPDAEVTIGTQYPNGLPNYGYMNLDNFKATIPAGEAGRVVKKCSTIVDVKIPAGYTLGEMSVNYSGSMAVANTSTKARIVTKLLAGEVNYIEPVQRNRYVVKNMEQEEFNFFKNAKFDSVGDIYDGACDQERTVQLEIVSRIVLDQNTPAATEAVAGVRYISFNIPFKYSEGLPKCKEPSDWSWDYSWGRDDNSEGEVLGNIKPAY